MAAPAPPAELVPLEASDVERSSTIMLAAGYRVIPLAPPLGPWEILASDARGLVLLATCRDGWPADRGLRFGLPAGFPLGTKRLVHLWGADGALPVAILTP